MQTGRTVEKSSKKKKNWFPMTSPDINFQGILKSLSMKIQLSRMKQWLFYGRKVKVEGHIFSSYTRNGVVFIQKSERSKPTHLESLI